MVALDLYSAILASAKLVANLSSGLAHFTRPRALVASFLEVEIHRAELRRHATLHLAFIWKKYEQSQNEYHRNRNFSEMQFRIQHLILPS